MTRKRYARGSRALGECQRSGKRVPHRDLVEDGNIPRLLVAPDWWEPKHPQETPPVVTDPISLNRPAPEISIPPGEGTPADISFLFPALRVGWSVPEITEDGGSATASAFGGVPPASIEFEWVGDHDGLEFVIDGNTVTVNLVEEGP